MKITTLLALLLFPLLALAQSPSKINGQLLGDAKKEPLPYPTVGLIPESSNLEKRYIFGDENGRFTFNNVTPGNYTLEFSFVGFQKAQQKITISEPRTYTITQHLKIDDNLIDEVTVNARATRATQQGDTIVYNAEAFKVLSGSSAEDLVSKMPGIVVEGGTVEAQGEEVKKVLVDGKEFFDGDVTLAMKTIPADIIASIEVFDKMSDQAAFTGFDDGEQTKTMNIRTKTGYIQGAFGEVYAGYGTNDRYTVGGNINMFNGDQRISILGLSNNINQQNFSQEDLAGVMSSSSSGRGGRRGPGGSSSSNFMVSSLSGVTSSNAVGINFVDEWGAQGKIKFSGSYFFNQSDNENDTETDRQYFDSTDGISSYWQNKDTSMDNYNHRFNGRIEYKIDDNNELVITPKFSFQDNTSISILDGISYLDGDATDYVTNNSISDVVKYNLSTDVTFRHKFKKRGRTMSIFMGGTLTNSQTETTSEISTTSTTEEENQFKDALSDKISLRGNVMFTENLFKYLQLSLTYRLSYTNTDADQKTFIQDKLSDLYDQIDSDQSSVYTSDYITQSGGIGLRFFKYGFSAMISADLQNASLVGDQSYPSIGSTDKNFTSLLPSMFVRYTLDRSNSFMFRYRSNTSSPDMDDLLDVIDESNPLFLTQGNPDLEQQTSHAVNIRYIRTSMAGTTFIAMLGGTIYDQYVGDNISILDDGVQLTKPINLDGYYSAQAMLTYGFPVGFMKSNINLSASANYSNTPYLYNDEEYTTRDLTLTPKVVIGSNISDKLDFTMSYSAAVNKALNSDEDSTSSDYISHSATGKLGWEFFNGFVVSSSLSYTGYSGISDTDDVEYYLLSAAITKRFLKNRAARIKVEATDILGQNQSFRSSVGSNYFEYTTSNVLESYVMVSFSYTFR